MHERGEITQLLNQVARQEENARDQLLNAVYDDLRRLAHSYFQNERANHTLQATELVHEAYLRLVQWENVTWQNRAHFFAVAAAVMRNILVDHARKRNALKRSGETVFIETSDKESGENILDVLMLEESLNKLAKQDQRQARIVELKFFGGLSFKEIAYLLDISERSVKREWAFAKAWLRREVKSN